MMPMEGTDMSILDPKSRLASATARSRNMPLAKEAFINRIATAVPPHDIHAAFLSFAGSTVTDEPAQAALLRRMTKRCGIEHRYSFLAPAPDPAGSAIDASGYYARGRFPSTAERMRFFEAHAPTLAAAAVERLLSEDERDGVTHLLLTCCTGYFAPGVDLELVERCRLRSSVERTIIGFMGCYAAINALKLARHIVRSEPEARVLVVSLELCTLHLQETTDLTTLLSFLLWGDGCAAALVSGEPQGLALDSFQSVLLPETKDLIEWRVRDCGFDMTLSGQVPQAVHDAIRKSGREILEGSSADAITLWAVHPGGRSVLDAVERAFGLAGDSLTASREVLRQFGNMSSATVLFVLAGLLRSRRDGARGCAMSFGPGLVAETMLFRSVGSHAGTAETAA